AADPALQSSLRYTVFGGEALEVENLRPWFERFGDQAPQLINMYGITETTVHVTYRPLSMADLDQVAASPIGEPIPDLSWYLLDADLNPVARGCTGELYVGRAGLARGYLNRGDLSATRFIPDPFGEQGGRLYRTGDLARYRADGVIEYIGRIDHQVKIRGFRIELGEIEARLLEQEGVREAVVLAQENLGSQQLVAYIVPMRFSADQQVQAEQRDALKAQLKDNLPDYMVPAHVLFLEQLPLTTNGKLDRKALPAPDAGQLQQQYIAPQTALEQGMAAIWQEVLGIEQVGLSDNFFELGGHSLLATQVVSRVRQALNIEAPLRTLFEHPDLAGFVSALDQGQTDTVAKIVSVKRNQPLAVSFAQQRQWILWQLEPHSAAYNIPTALRLKGQLNIEALKQSFNALIARHETLRTTFVQADGQTFQLIQASLTIDLEVEVASFSSDECEVAIQSFVETEAARPFNLEKGPLLRAKLLRLAPEDHVLTLTLHHIVADGWSMPIMVEELIKLYGGHSQGLLVDLPALPIQYVDYAIWQRNWMAAGELQRQLSYWTGQLGSEQPVLELPHDRPRPAVQSYRGTRLEIPFDNALANDLKLLAKREGVTTFMLLLASYQTLLHRYSGQSDIRVGVPIANRNRLETEGLIGFFVNTQVLRAQFDALPTFNQLLQQVKQAALDAQRYQDLPFDQLVDALQPERSMSHNPLFQVLFNYQRDESQKALVERLSGLHIEGLPGGNHTAQFDLTLDIVESAGGFGVSLNYATDLFDASTIERMAGHWLNLLKAVVATPEQRVGELPLLDVAERGEILHDWNPQQAEYPSNRCIHERITEQAERSPEAIALNYGSEHLTYEQLNSRANQLAHRLIELGVGPEARVGLATERSLEMIVGLLAILKAGGAYVPLDPEYPEDRLSYMMQDSGIALLLTQSHLQERLPVFAGQTLLLGQDLSAYSTANPAVQVDPANLAYIIYTSGSTGMPKGTLLPHHNVMRLFQATEHWFHFDEKDVWTMFHSYAFDFSVWEIFGALMYGGRLVVVPYLV
ncbi:condensation domain-containing protein, partial [Pseudomonas sp. MAFF 302046]